MFTLKKTDIWQRCACTAKLKAADRDSIQYPGAVSDFKKAPIGAFFFSPLKTPVNGHFQMQKNTISAQPVRGFEQQQLFNEFDELSKKRLSLHKVAIHDRETNQVKEYRYHLVIIDPVMTINVELAENTIVNLVNSMKK